MRDKTLSFRFQTVGILVISCLSLVLILSGCKKKTEETVRHEQPKQVESKVTIQELTQPIEIVGKELVDGLDVPLEVVSVSEADFPWEPKPRLIKIQKKVRRSKIKIDGTRYDVLLAPYRGTDFCLIPTNNSEDFPRWIGAQQIKSTHLIKGKYYSFDKTQDGNKLLIRSHEGDFGTFEVDAGKRDIQNIGIQGSLRSRDGFSIAVSGELEKGWPTSIRSCQLPVGDYTPVYLQVTIGKLQVSLSDNYYHMDKQGNVQRSHKSYHSIKIRQNQPFALDFSAKPQVWVVKPDKDQRVSLGHELKVEAVLVEPRMDIMIRRIFDTTQKEQRKYTTSDGQQKTVEVTKSIEPKVRITRANGEKVAEGVMPFG
jgi:hypothetical protein